MMFDGVITNSQLVQWKVATSTGALSSAGREVHMAALNKLIKQRHAGFEVREVCKRDINHRRFHAGLASTAGVATQSRCVVFLRDNDNRTWYVDPADDIIVPWNGERCSLRALQQLFSMFLIQRRQYLPRADKVWQRRLQQRTTLHPSSFVRTRQQNQCMAASRIPMKVQQCQAPYPPCMVSPVAVLNGLLTATMSHHSTMIALLNRQPQQWMLLQMLHPQVVQYLQTISVQRRQFQSLHNRTRRLRSLPGTALLQRELKTVLRALWLCHHCLLQVPRSFLMFTRVALRLRHRNAGASCGGTVCCTL